MVCEETFLWNFGRGALIVVVFAAFIGLVYLCFALHNWVYRINKMLEDSENLDNLVYFLKSGEYTLIKKSELKTIKEKLGMIEEKKEEPKKSTEEVDDDDDLF